MTIDLSDGQLDALLKRLHLANARRAWRELVQRAEREEWSYRDFLALLVSEEIAQRQQTRLARMVRRARFPFLKTIDDFNFTYQSTVRLSLLGSALAPDFITEGRCVIFGGKPGRGKTHLAVAIAYRAIQNGFDALFVTAAELIDDLSAAFRHGRLADTLDRYVHPAVLVVDEVGYLTYGTDAANILFHVVNDRHRKKRAMVFTTNKPLTGWGCTTRTWHTRSSIGSLSAVVCLHSMDRRCGLDIWGLTTPRQIRHQLRRPVSLGKAPEFPESSGQNFRNPQLSC
jgi:DNA replication protein DnaC